jgi:hypothetical protein
MLGRWRLNVRLVDSAAEKQLELWASRPEIGSRSKREVKLQAAGEQENPIQSGSARQVEQVNGIELRDEAAGPVLKHIENGSAITHRECEIEV